MVSIAVNSAAHCSADGPVRTACPASSPQSRWRLAPPAVSLPWPAWQRTLPAGRRLAPSRQRVQATPGNPAPVAVPRWRRRARADQRRRAWDRSRNPCHVCVHADIACRGRRSCLLAHWTGRACRSRPGPSLMRTGRRNPDARVRRDDRRRCAQSVLRPTMTAWPRPLSRHRSTDGPRPRADMRVRLVQWGRVRSRAVSKNANRDWGTGTPANDID